MLEPVAVVVATVVDGATVVALASGVDEAEPGTVVVLLAAAAATAAAEVSDSTGPEEHLAGLAHELDGAVLVLDAGQVHDRRCCPGG